MNKVYFVESAVRSVHTRTVRAQNPERHRFKQFILGGTLRLVRNRPVQVTEDQFVKFYDELKGKVSSGAIVVREGSADGPFVDFSKSLVKKVIEKQNEAKKLMEEIPVKDEDKKEEKKEEKDKSDPPSKKKKQSKKKGN